MVGAITVKKISLLWTGISAGDLVRDDPIGRYDFGFLLAL
jgi:hypothetical protein